MGEYRRSHVSEARSVSSGGATCIQRRRLDRQVDRYVAGIRAVSRRLNRSITGEPLAGARLSVGEAAIRLEFLLSSVVARNLRPPTSRLFVPGEAGFDVAAPCEGLSSHPRDTLPTDLRSDDYHRDWRWYCLLTVPPLTQSAGRRPARLHHWLGRITRSTALNDFHNMPNLSVGS